MAEIKDSLTGESFSHYFLGLELRLVEMRDSPYQNLHGCLNGTRLLGLCLNKLMGYLRFHGELWESVWSLGDILNRGSPTYLLIPHA